MDEPSRRSDPIENMNTYVMVHGGIDRHERLLDIDWLRDLNAAAIEIANAFDEESADKAIDNLRRVLRRHPKGGFQ